MAQQIHALRYCNSSSQSPPEIDSQANANISLFSYSPHTGIAMTEMDVHVLA